MVGTRAWADPSEPSRTRAWSPEREDAPARERAGPSTTRRELLGFATVGLLAYAVDLALFTFLRGPVALGPLTAKALSFVAGCTVAYVGNALGTYRHAHPTGVRPYAVFVAVNIAGAAVQLLCLTVSHYCLGFTSQRADTVSGAGIGMALATVLRFWGTRTLVFRTEGRVGSWTG
ncbi:GtrA family protein [Streptomyces sp. HD]|uniref:GtrA family protein n=1 Tax=Streptomyces sp. HD TaxID=3020892 RepID=UPI002330CC90|nr:GtrA family protein [Streptomyces sp. HD]MDC0765901.1 GtrA family protein [Streptomyces sp. HD]